MTDDPARPVPPGQPLPPAVGEGDDGHEENAGEQSPRRGRSWQRAVLIALGALALATVGLLLWAIRAGGPGGPPSSVRSDLARSAALLRDAPALHYAGTIDVKGQGEARLDLVVSNPGDALGTLTMPESPALDFVAIAGKSFLRGNAEAWRSIGMADKSELLAEQPRLVGPGLLFSQDLATALTPPALAKALLLEKVPDEEITVGEAVSTGDHTCTPVRGDSMTFCLGQERVGGARFVDRISFPGGSTVLTIKAMSRLEVKRFSADFQSKLTMTHVAVNPRIRVTTQILTDYEGDCAPTLCIFKARTTVTFLGSTAASEASEPVQVNYAWTIERDGAPVKVGADCSGAVLVKPGQSTDLSCTGTGPSVPAGGPSRGKYHGRIVTSDVALTEAEYTRLVRLAVDNSKKVAALADLPPPS
ncbi:hypothetical protein [Streptomyces sp. NPDC006879]|uniref:hypothetical protein n=1 Tax=Streptomyces sp. NPDC006879 TaxID=3364767 RepID=UPI003676CFC3